MRVPVYVDGVDESAEANHTLQAKVVASTDGSYTVGTQGQAHFDILDPPATIPRISVVKDSTSVAEGDAATFTLTRTGDTASTLTVQVIVDDPQGFTRGDFWDPPPELPTSVEFDANSSTATLSLQTVDDYRDVPNGSITVEVKPPDMGSSVRYLPGHTGLETSASTTVTDDDTAQELELNFGKDGTNGAAVFEGNTDKSVHSSSNAVSRMPTPAIQRASRSGWRPTGAVTIGGWRAGPRTPVPVVCTGTTRFS